MSNQLINCTEEDKVTWEILLDNVAEDPPLMNVEFGQFGTMRFWKSFPPVKDEHIEKAREVFRQRAHQIFGLSVQDIEIDMTPTQEQMLSIRDRTLRRGLIGWCSPGRGDELTGFMGFGHGTN